MTDSILDQIINGLVFSAAQESNFIGNPDVLKGLKWQEVPERDGRSLLVREDDPDSEPAVFWTVAEISTSDFWLYADGRWNNKLKKSFSEHAATAAFVRPSDQRLAKLYDVGLEGVEDVQNFSKRLTIFHPLLQRDKYTAKPFLKLRHQVFDCSPRNFVRTEDDDSSNQHGEDSNDQKWAGLETEWPLEKWPCITPEADYHKGELLKNTQLEYKPRLLEAYDKDGEPIPPNMYRQKLRGVTVSCYFSITPWNIENQYPFAPHIVTLWTVISPPVPTPHTPKRRQGESTNPRKKMRAA